MIINGIPGGIIRTVLNGADNSKDPRGTGNEDDFLEGKYNSSRLITSVSNLLMYSSKSERNSIAPKNRQLHFTHLGFTRKMQMSGTKACCVRRGVCLGFISESMLLNLNVPHQE